MSNNEPSKAQSDDNLINDELLKKRKSPPKSGIVAMNDKPPKKRKSPLKLAAVALVGVCLCLAMLSSFGGDESDDDGGVTSSAQIAESTAVATDIPEPTDEPEPTDTSEPTDEPAPTDTPEPTDEPVSVAGLGVSRAEFVDLFTQADFTFDDSSDVDGRPRVMAESPNGLAMLEVIGEPNDVYQVSLMAEVAGDEAESLYIAVYMLGLLQTAVPEWGGSADWFSENVGRLVDEPEISTVQADKLIRLNYYDALGMIILTVEASE